ncbi:oxidoreductase [Prauserella sp. PE36]|uniref:SDR family NAD(P)-dependent oxidoreductase n=1 Tax=Prauserella sp. PE36 TaxID=1504709 RepID=UPI000DE42984|nr:SDR family NAD(P)-dependent oxidoreductase [Prauserella sp. PE36]RBM12557.1 oxidoreductase [Prauserella sp. PE36]
MTESTARPLAVVTGASTGIGREFARCLAEDGHDLLLAAENTELADAAREVGSQSSAVETVRADLATADGVEELARRVRAKGRPVDVLAINAGVGVSGAFAEAETSLEDQLRVVDLNVRSAVHFAKLLVPDMAARGRGRILFTSSVAATTPGPFQAVYGASKAFLQSFSQALREELKETGVTVTAVLPGPTATEFFARARMLDTKIGAGPKDDAGEVARQAYAALKAGRDSVVAGSLRNRVQAAVARFTPERFLAAAHRRMAEPGTARR